MVAVSFTKNKDIWGLFPEKRYYTAEIEMDTMNLEERSGVVNNFMLII